MASEPIIAAGLPEDPIGAVLLLDVVVLHRAFVPDHDQGDDECKPAEDRVLR